MHSDLRFLSGSRAQGIVLAYPPAISSNLPRSVCPRVPRGHPESGWDKLQAERVLPGRRLCTGLRAPNNRASISTAGVMTIEQDDLTVVSTSLQALLPLGPVTIFTPVTLPRRFTRGRCRWRAFLPYPDDACNPSSELALLAPAHASCDPSDGLSPTCDGRRRSA